MGGGRDKRKKQKGHATAGKGANKTARKTELNDTKAQRRSQKAAQVAFPAVRTLCVGPRLQRRITCRHRADRRAGQSRVQAACCVSSWLRI